jgi:hypothetical protein
MQILHDFTSLSSSVRPHESACVHALSTPGDVPSNMALNNTFVPKVVAMKNENGSVERCAVSANNSQS